MSGQPSSAARFIDRLLADHRDIEAFAFSLYVHTERGDCVQALAVLVELRRLVVRHDGLEEDVLFPLLGRGLPALGERLKFARGQHRSFAELYRDLEAALVLGDVRTATHHSAELHALLVGNHNVEELVLFGCLELLDDVRQRYAATHPTPTGDDRPPRS